MKYCFLLLFFLIICQSGFAIRLPKNPKNPKKPTVTKRGQQNDKKDDPIQYYSFKVNIILNKGSKAEGTIRLKQDYLSVVNKKGDFTYKKKLLFKDIKEIKITNWQGQIVKRKGKPSEKPYVFYPSKYTITTSDGKVYVYTGRLHQFERFALNNLLFGKTTVYSFFYDYWIKKGKKGYWVNSKSGDFNYNKTNGHPKALAKIIFVKDKKK